MRTPKRWTGAKAGLAAGLLALGVPGARGGLVVETLVLSGEAAPGTGGVAFGGFGSPALNAVGQVVFEGFLTGPGVNSENFSGVWSTGGGTPGLVARAGDTAPDTGGAVFTGFNFPVIDAGGRVAFLGDLDGADVTGGNDTGLWSEAGGGLVLVTRAGDAAPGAGPAVFSAFSTPVLNGTGRVAFRADLGGVGVTPGSDSGVWSQGGGTLGLVAREGSAAPGSGGAVFGVFTTPSINGAGQTAFRAELTGTGVNADNNAGVWSEAGGSLGLVAREGGVAPGAGGAVFSGFSSPGINDAGRTAFFGLLSGTGVTAGNDSGVWSEAGGTLGLVAREGDAAPGAGGAAFLGFNSPMFNGADQTAFIAALTGAGVGPGNDRGLWLEAGGALGLVARTGNAAPGAGGDVFAALNDPVLNGVGQTAFLGELSGAGVNTTNDRGLWATDTDGVLKLIVREGHLFDVNDDPFVEDHRTVSFVDLIVGSGGQDGRDTSFNDAGQLAFRLLFTDGSQGLFMTTVTATLAGDYNDDGFVDQGDLDLVLLNWGDDTSVTGVPVGWLEQHPTGLIGQSELDGVLLNWGAGAEASANPALLPEPGTAGLLGVGVAFAMRRTREVKLPPLSGLDTTPTASLARHAPGSGGRSRAASAPW